MLIESRFLPPRLQSTTLARRRHLERYFRGLPENAVTLVLAPAGYGKTTLLADWRRRLLMDRHHVAWLSVDDGDNEVSQFVAYIFGALHRAWSYHGEPSETAFMSAAGNLSPDRAAGFIVNEISRLDGHVFLLFDDSHVLRSDKAVKVIEDLALLAPANLHLILASRRTPDFSLVKLRTGGALQELDAQQIRFNLQETTEFFRLRGHTALRLSDIDQLHQLTEGWVTGLCLASQSLKNKYAISEVVEGLSGRSQEISHYISEVVHKHLDARKQSWLIKTAMFDRFCPALCDEVFGGSDSAAIIEYLSENMPLFMPLDDERGWVRLHRLLRDFLLQEWQRLEQDERKRLHERAVKWFAARGEIIEAINHAVAAGNETVAVNLIEGQSRDLVAAGNILLLMSWYEKLPASLFRQRFDLQLNVAWALILSIRCEEAARYAAELEAEIENGREVDFESRMELLAVKATIAAITDEPRAAIAMANRYLARSNKRDPWVVGVIANVLTYCHQIGCDYERALEAQLYVEPWPVTKRSPFTVIYGDCVEGRVHECRGDTRQALAQYHAALARAENLAGRRSVPAALPAAFLAALLYDMNKPFEARQVMAGRLDIACSMIPPTPILRGGLAIVRAHMAEGDVERAKAELDHMEGIARSVGFDRVVAACIAERVSFALQKNNFKEAKWHLDALQPYWRDECDPRLRTVATEINNLITVARIRYNCLPGSPAEAEEEAQRFVSQAEHFGHLEDQILGYVLLAQAQRARGKLNEAAQSLIAAMRHAMPSGKVRIFFDERASLQSIVERIAHGIAVSCPVAIAHLVDALCAAPAEANNSAGRVQGASSPAPGKGVHAFFPPPANDAAHDTQPLPTALTDRELEILACLAKGMTNKEIASALTISPETVKWYLKKVYEKLGAGNRAHAVRVAHKAQLL
ncbi:MAG: LuxR C-terminal-related transcriptional regulator [Pseudomonadota bacterium]